MPTTSWDSEDDFDDGKSNSGFTNDGLGDHTGRDTLQRGYEYGSLTRGLVAYYPFDGTVNDATPLGNDGTDNTSEGYVSGQVGSDAKDFDGNDDYVDVPNSIADTLKQSGSYTFALWVKTSDASVQGFTIGGGDGAGSASRTERIFESSYETFHKDSNGSLINTSAPISSDTWTHFVTTWSDTTNELILYKDGAEESSTSTGDGFQDYTNVTIGCKPDISAHLLGQIDDVRIYDRTLSQQEIQALSNLTSTQTVTNGDVL